MFSRITFIVTCFFSACLLAQPSAFGVATNWTGVGNWTEDPGNWSAGVPTGADDADIDSGTVTIDSTSLSSAPVANTLDVDAGTLNMSDQTLTISGLMRVGQSGVGTVNQSGGDLLIGGNFDMNNAGTGNGSSYDFTGGTFGFSGSGNFTIGRTASFTHNNALHTLVVPGNMHIGNVGAGNAVFNLDAGGVDVQGNLILGENQNNTSTFNFAAGTTIALSGATSTFNMKGTSTFNLSSGQSLSSPTNVQIGSGTGASIFNLNGGTLSVFTDLDISVNSDNAFEDEFNFNSGSIVFGSGTTSDVRIGRTGTFTYDNAATFNIPGNLIVGSIGAGSAIFNILQGTVEVDGNVILGENQNNISTLNIAAGGNLLLTGLTSTFNMKGTGTFNLNSGQSLTSPTNVQVGSGAGSSIFNLNGGTLTIATDLDLAVNGDSAFEDQFNFNSGSIVFGGGTSSDVRIGRTGTFNYNNGATFEIPGNLFVGSIGAGSAAFNVLQGTVDVKGNVIIGENQNNVGTLTISPGASLTLTGPSSTFNMKGTGTFNLNSGQTLSSPTNVQVGSGSGNSIFNLNGGTLTIATDLDIAVNGDSTFVDEFNLNSGTINFGGGASSDLRIGRAGEFNHNKPGTTVVPGLVHIGSIGAGDAVMNLNAGTLQVAGNVTLGTNTNNTGTLNVAASATLEIQGTSDLIQTANTSVVSSGTILVGEQLIVGNTAGTSDFTQNGGLVQVGGNLLLAQNGSSTGTYTLNGGTLNVLGTINVNGNAGTDTFNLAGGRLSAGTLQLGDGVFTYTGGILSPGLTNNPVTMSIVGDLIMPSSGGVEVDLDTPFVLAGPNDLIAITGDLTLDGVVTVNGLANFTSGRYPIMTFTGSFTDLGLETTSPNFTIDVILNEGGLGGTVYLLAIPEPSSATLLGYGLLGLAMFRRRRKHAVCQY